MTTALTKFRLVNTETKEVIRRNVTLTEGERSILNYAYALNGTSLKFIK
jgi:hypothetical protein